MTERLDQLLEQWKAWMKDILRDLYGIHHDREMWKAVTAAIYDSVPPTPPYWVTHYRHLYVDGQTVAIRRLIRSAGADTVTLGKLLESIALNAELLTADWYLSLLPEHNRVAPWIDDRLRDFRRDWDDGSGKVDAQRIRRDKAELNQIAQKVVDFADAAVAHLTEGRPRPSLTFGELDEAIDNTGRLFQTYAALLTNTHYALTPDVDDEWRSTFFRPLFKPPEWWPADIDS